MNVKLKWLFALFIPTLYLGVLASAETRFTRTQVAFEGLAHAFELYEKENSGGVATEWSQLMGYFDQLQLETMYKNMEQRILFTKDPGIIDINKRSIVAIEGNAPSLNSKSGGRQIISRINGHYHSICEQEEMLTTHFTERGMLLPPVRPRVNESLTSQELLSGRYLFLYAASGALIGLLWLVQKRMRDLRKDTKHL